MSHFFFQTHGDKSKSIILPLSLQRGTCGMGNKCFLFLHMYFIVFLYYYLVSSFFFITNNPKTLMDTPLPLMNHI